MAKSVKVPVVKNTLGQVRGLRFPASVDAELVRIAEQTERSVQFWVRKFVADGLKRFGRKQQ